MKRAGAPKRKRDQEPFRALVLAATKARERAHAPYSHFKVGAAVMLEGGAIVTGVNVENASYGLTVCAERHAIAAAVAAGAAPGDIEAVAIVTAAPHPTPPCGACRQVLAEFAGADLPVILRNLEGDRVERHTLGELLPLAFVKDDLPSP